MKLLRSPIVTGLLVLLAVGVVCYQIFAPQWARSRVNRAAQPVVAAVAAVANALGPPPKPAVLTQVAENNAALDLVPDLTIDRDYTKTHFDAWVDSPARDPFLLLGPQPLPIDIDSETNSPIRKMKLRGIWDQTGSRVAVIDREVYRQGDEIGDYKLIEIGTDEVWFQGPTRKERLGLEKRQPTAFVPGQHLPPPHS